jgi:hypothetical protein
VHLNKGLMMERLSAALLTEAESEALGGVCGWKGLADPFFGGRCAEQYFEIPEYLQVPDGAESGSESDGDAASSPSFSSPEDTGSSSDAEGESG